MASRTLSHSWTKDYVRVFPMPEGFFLPRAPSSRANGTARHVVSQHGTVSRGLSRPGSAGLRAPGADALGVGPETETKTVLHSR